MENIFTEPRDSRRLEVKFPLSFSFLSEDSQEREYIANTTDFSATGLGLTMDHSQKSAFLRISEGDTHLSLNLMNQQEQKESIKFKGRVVWQQTIIREESDPRNLMYIDVGISVVKNVTYLLGIEIVEIEPEVKEKLYQRISAEIKMSSLKKPITGAEKQ